VNPVTPLFSFCFECICCPLETAQSNFGLWGVNDCMGVHNTFYSIVSVLYWNVLVGFKGEP
jgi:hypothetical protein